MKNNSFVADIISPYYLHKVTTDSEMIKGILFNLNITQQNLKNFRPHEDIDISKANRITEALLSGNLHKQPIIAGATHDDFSKLLDQYRQCDLSILAKPNDGSDIDQAIYKITELILIDGHHRYAAANKALLLGKSVSLWCWIVPFEKLKLHSFVKVFTKHNSIDINKLINDKYKESAVEPEFDGNGLEIVLFLHSTYYQFLAKFEEEFLIEMERLKAKLNEDHLILIQGQEVECSNHDTLAIEGSLIMWHSQITHKMVLNVVNRGTVLPLHSTCFKPKPEEIPEHISNL